MTVACKEYMLRGALMDVTVSPTGAGIRSVLLKSLPCTGKPAERNQVLSFAEPGVYGANSLYAGATLAPAAGRVRDGLVSLDGAVCQLAKNENAKTHLHGGPGNLSFRDWEVHSVTASAVTFRTFLPAGWDGYPGNREFEVSYLLEGRVLTIAQRMESDAPTYVNLSSHVYYNLNGFTAPPSVQSTGDGSSTDFSFSALDQSFQTDAAQVIYNDANHIPVRVEQTAGTPFDFSVRQSLADVIRAHRSNPQLLAAKGYNHYFLTGRRPTAPACSLLSSDGQIELRLYTDAPAFVLYSGGFIGNEYRLRTDDGSLLRSYPGCGIAIEPSSLPPSLFAAHGETRMERSIRLEWHV